MLKRFKIDGRMQEVFVLRQSDTRIVYVPVKSMHRVDYERFKEMSTAKPPRADLLEYMSKTKLKNGVNALVQYDNLIHVANINKDGGTRIKKTEEIIDSFEHNALVKGDAHTKEQPQPQIVYVQAPVQQVQAPVQSDVQDDVQSLSTKESDAPKSYRFVDKHGKTRIWGGQGRKPDAIQEHLDAGGSLDDFLEK